MTVWDARPVEKQDEGFLAAAEATRRACDQMGWRYEVFSGLTTTLRMNLLWLDGFRQVQPWYSSAWSKFAPPPGETTTIGEVLKTQDSGGHVLSAMWHHIRHGRLRCDLRAPLAAPTQLTNVEVTDG